VSGALAAVLIALALVLALWTAVWAARDRLPPRGQLQGVLLLQAGLLAQAGLVLSRLGGWRGPVIELVGYLLVSALLLPAGMVLAVEERTRWGTLVLALACLTVAVVVVRLLAVWSVGA